MLSKPESIPVLYVDDTVALHEPFRIFMESDGNFEVQTCSSPVEAFVRISDGRYGAIVSDFQMPEMDGIELLKKLRSHNIRTPFILFTGKGREEVVISAINNGADFYLQKGGDPISQFAELSHFIKTAVNNRRAASEIEDAKNQLSSIFESTSDTVFLFDAEGRVLRVNHAFEQMFGMSRQDIIGAKLSGAGMSRLSNVERALRTVLAGDGPTRHDEVQVDADGNVKYLDVITNPIVDRAGQISFVTCSARDITGPVRMHAMTKLLHETSSAVLKEKSLRSIFSTFCMRLQSIFGFRGVTILLNEANGEISLLADERGLPEYGKDEPSMREDSPAVRAIRTGQMHIAKAGDFSFKSIAGIASHRGFDSVIALPLRYADEIVGSMCIYGNNLGTTHSDTVAQMQSAADALSVAVRSSRLRDRLKLLDTALQNATDTIVLTDRSGMILWTNRAFTETTGYQKDEVIGKTPRVLKSGKHGADFYKRLWETILAGGVFHEVITNKRKNGELYFEDTVITPVRDANNVISSFVAIKREIKEP
ncbi:MAG: PAS domain S-box protein [Methanomassiliicoccales archaeon]|nr:PAS domain S-box protein [Methanomassiliicoccales archaeon]